jgi:hypothetical protein
MKLHFIEEPILEFGQDESVCPREGIATYNVYDSRFTARREKLLVGAVGTGEGIIKLRNWLDRCKVEILPTKESKHPKLNPGFPGFNREFGFKAELATSDELSRSINNSQIKEITKIGRWNERIDEAVELYYQNIKFLAQNRQVDMIVCTLSDDLYKAVSKIERENTEKPPNTEEPDDLYETNFRRSLKAKAMHLGKPIRLVREQSLQVKSKGQQDDPTRAWNFCTALYYKGNQTVPWKLKSNINKPSVCYVGIGFYRSRDRKVLNTSLAQIFDELGNGVILRGTPVEQSKDDRQPHLKSDQANSLLYSALDEYRQALGNIPARLVIHKTSNFNDAELDGFRSAVKAHKINTVDFVTIFDTSMRLLRDGQYPPYRGTHVELDENNHILYTRGSVKFYQTYPGLYIPRPLEIRLVEYDESPSIICQEILGLTKMNWNNTQFDGKYPITIECARKVGQIMKYLSEEDKPQIRYSFYM